MRTKLILSFTIILIALLTIGYLGQTTIYSLISSIQEESRPNVRLELLNTIQADLIDVENSVRTFTITREAEDLTTYYRKVSQLDHKMNELYKLSPDSTGRQEVEVIGTLIDQKLDVLNQIVYMSDDDRIDEVLHKVLMELEEVDDLKDQPEIKGSIKEPEIDLSLQTLDSLASRNEMKEPKYGFFKKLFGSKKRDKREKEEVASSAAIDEKPIAQPELREDSLTTEVTLSQDTLLPVSSLRDSALFMNEPRQGDGSIKGIIEKIETEEEQLSRMRTARELKLIQNDKTISDKIRQRIIEMESIEETRSLQRAHGAEDLIFKTRQIILYTMMGSIVVFLVLLAIIFNDIARQNRQRKALKEAKEESERLAAVKQEFLSNVSHEIRTPLNAIIGFAEQLKGTLLTTDQKDHLYKILSSSEHLMMLINDILDLSKIEKGKLELNSEAFKPYAEVNESIDLIRPTLLSKNLDLNVNIIEIESVILKGDPFRYRQILINLLSNAVKFTEKGGIDLECFVQRDGEEVVLSTVVRDTGIGIPKDKLAYIFDYFTQIDGGNTRQFGGTGLGLSIVKNLVDIQKGTIEVKSIPGEGSVFSFKIPYTEASEEEFNKKLPEGVNDVAAFSSRRILIVDDHSYNLELMSTILKKWGANTKSASSGKEAMEQLSRDEFDAVLMDIQMPGMSGLDVIKAHQNKYPTKSLSFIAVTADPEPRVVEELLHAGFKDVVSKPFKTDTLYKVLLSILSGAAHTVAFDNKKPEQGMEPSKPYQLDELTHLSEGDSDFQINMLELFIKTTDENLKDLKNKVENNDFESAAAIAHKAVPPCRHLNIWGMVDKLKLIEQTCKQELPDVPTINYQALEFEWKSIKPLLIKDIKVLKKQT